MGELAAHGSQGLRLRDRQWCSLGNWAGARVGALSLQSHPGRELHPTGPQPGSAGAEHPCRPPTFLRSLCPSTCDLHPSQLCPQLYNMFPAPKRAGSVPLAQRVFPASHCNQPGQGAAASSHTPAHPPRVGYPHPTLSPDHPGTAHLSTLPAWAIHTSLGALPRAWPCTCHPAPPVSLPRYLARTGRRAAQGDTRPAWRRAAGRPRAPPLTSPAGRAGPGLAALTFSGSSVLDFLLHS